MTSEPISYATPTVGPNPTWRLVAFVFGGMGFTFLGGCFCIGILYLIAIVRRGGPAGLSGPSPLDATETALAFVLAAMAIVCFATALLCIIRAFQFDRGTR